MVGRDSVEPSDSTARQSDSFAPAHSPLPKRLSGPPGGLPARRVLALPLKRSISVRSYLHELAVGVDELGYERTDWFLAQIGDGSLLNNASLVHENNGLGKVGRLSQVVRDQKDGLAKTGKDFFQVFL